MEKKVFTMWEMNLGFRPKDFQSVWGAVIRKNSPKQSCPKVKAARQGRGTVDFESRAWSV